MTQSSTTAASSVGPGSGRSALMHIALNVIDVDATLAFYGEAFGYEQTYTWTRAEVVDSDQVLFEGHGTYLDVGGGAYLELFPTGTEGQSMTSGSVAHLSLAVEDIDSVYDRALRCGAKPATTNNPTYWNGKPTTIDLNGEPRLRERVAYVEGINGELIEIYEILTPIVTRP